jgi:hypothetical protein
LASLTGTTLPPPQRRLARRSPFTSSTPSQPPVERLVAPGPRIEERYEVDPNGVIAVTITDLDAGYAERHVL